MSKEILAAPLLISASLFFATSKFVTSIFDAALELSHELKRGAVIIKANNVIVFYILSIYFCKFKKKGDYNNPLPVLFIFFSFVYSFESLSKTPLIK